MPHHPIPVGGLGGVKAIQNNRLAGSNPALNHINKRNIMKIDGLKLLVQFYANFNQLNLVAKQSGVSEDKLRNWLNGGQLSSDDRKLLTKDIGQSFTGTVIIK